MSKSISNEEVSNAEEQSSKSRGVKVESFRSEQLNLLDEYDFKVRYEVGSIEYEGSL